MSVDFADRQTQFRGNPGGQPAFAVVDSHLDTERASRGVRNRGEITDLAAGGRAGNQPHFTGFVAREAVAFHLGNRPADEQRFVVDKFGYGITDLEVVADLYHQVLDIAVKWRAHHHPFQVEFGPFDFDARAFQQGLAFGELSLRDV